MKYIAFYKCRMCDKVYSDGTTTNNKKLITNGIVALSLNIRRDVDVGIFPTLITAHACNDGSFGIADFHGFKASEE